MNKNKQINIFIVEDNKVFTLALEADIANTFSKMPIKVQSFGTCETCKEQFKQAPPQIVITDYHLNSKFPDAIDGIQFLDWIKKESPETYVIILTADDDINVALKAFHHGASDYVVKTETKFRKINYSLSNIFKIIEAKDEAKRNKSQVMILVGALVLIVGFALVTSLLRV